MTQQPVLPEEPRVVLSRAAGWITRFGTILIIAGAALAIVADLRAASLPIIKMIAAILIWLVPGAIYLITARGLLRRKRWAITSAETTTYAQMGLAGVLVLVALLDIKTLWPLLLIAALWLAGLIPTPRRLTGLSEAMDQLAVRVRE